MRNEQSLGFGVQVRCRYPGAVRPLMADGRRVPLDAVSVRSMNRGQPWRTPGIVEVAFSLEVPRGFLLEVIAEGRPDLEDDLRRHGEADGPFERWLVEAGYPSAEAIVASEEAASLALGYYRDEILLHWLGDRATGRPGSFVVNRIDEAVLDASWMLLRGSGRWGGTQVRFQDV